MPFCNSQYIKHEITSEVDRLASEVILQVFGSNTGVFLSCSVQICQHLCCMAKHCCDAVDIWESRPILSGTNTEEKPQSDPPVFICRRCSVWTCCCGD
ncbi:hypothetical protein SRHO_G00158490 [Serrasalmus rhombeus]